VRIEAEVKARLRDPDHVRAEPARRASEEVAVYSDTYFDSPDGSFTSAGREMLATVVRLSEIDGTFIEIETLIDERDVSAALEEVPAVLAELGVEREDETTETYTGAVRAARK
jgi:adenylate cyclase class IV